jgi:hypothetical protein
MPKRFHKEVYSFAVLSSKNKIYELAKVLKAFKLPFKIIKQKKNYSLIINIKNGFDLLKIKNLIKKAKISKKSCSIKVDLISNSDMDGLTFPKYVAELYKYFGGNLSILVQLYF